jgi:tRNA threonylcarbamoyladenosine biosynthesis protein TsaB
MNIFIDTALKGCVIALFDAHNVIAHIQKPIERGHAETLLPMINDLILSVNRSIKDIQNIYVTIGPGSFTGLRVCLTAAQFMAYSQGKKAQGITTFQAFSSLIKDDVPRMVLVDTKRDDYFVQMMQADHQIMGEPSVMAANAICKILADYPNAIITGDAAERFVQETQWSDNKAVFQEMINSESVVNALQSEILSLHKAGAYYIRDADVTINHLK